MFHWQVDGDTSTNDCVIALASGLSGANQISSLNNSDALHLQACVDAVCKLIYFLLSEYVTLLTQHIVQILRDFVRKTNDSCENVSLKIAQIVGS